MLNLVQTNTTFNKTDLVFISTTYNLSDQNMVVCEGKGVCLGGGGEVSTSDKVFESVLNFYNAFVCLKSITNKSAVVKLKLKKLIKT